MRENIFSLGSPFSILITSKEILSGIVDLNTSSTSTSPLATLSSSPGPTTPSGISIFCETFWRYFFNSFSTAISFSLSPDPRMTQTADSPNIIFSRIAFLTGESTIRPRLSVVNSPFHKGTSGSMDLFPLPTLQG